MSKPRLIYFDFAGSRGEECRIALHLAGVDFDDAVSYTHLTLPTSDLV